MMTFDPARARELAASARPVDDILGSAAEPGVLSGALSEVPRGIGRGLLEAQGVAASGLTNLTQPVYDILGDATGTNVTNPFADLRDLSDAAARRLAPDPLTVGAAGQIINGIGSITSEIAAGAVVTAATGGLAPGALMWGGAATAGAATGRSAYRELLDQGVDPSTAANVAYETALVTGGGALLPAGIGYNAMAQGLSRAGLIGLELPKAAYLGANASLGAATNAGMGVIQRGLVQNTLQAGGYDLMARQYAPMDSAAITADAVLGSVFSSAGAVAGIPLRAAPTIDAALAARDSQDAHLTRAPGLPADPASAQAHQQALDKAVRDVWNGNPVDVSQTGVVDGSFVPAARDTTVQNAARAQYGTPRPTIYPTTRLVDLAPADRSALPYNAPELNEYAAHVEQQNGLPSGLLNAIKNAGEKSNSNQVSPAGARGVMQFTQENLRKYGVTDPTDPVQMIDAAGRYLSDTMRQYGGNLDAVIADYNGGPRQAREVLAGRQPTAPETRNYLARVQEDMGRGQTYAETAPDMQNTVFAYPEERARQATAIEREITDAEAQHAELSASAGQLADFGQISAVRNELDALRSQRDALNGDAALRQAAKDIQSSGPQISYKQALSQARRESTQTASDLNAQIERLQSTIDRNADASKALQQLSELDRHIADLRANREAIPAPASQLTAITEAVRSMRGTQVGSAESSAVRDEGGSKRAGQPDAMGEPPIAPGMTRLYHGSAQHGRYEGPAWFSSNREYAANYREGAELQYVDYPTEKINAVVDPDGYGQTVDRGFTFNRELDSSETGLRRPLKSENPIGRQSTTSALARESGRGATPTGQDDIETQAGLALLGDRGDIMLPTTDANGNEIQISLRDLLDQANAELEYGKPEAFEAAVLCQLRHGGA